MLAILIGAAVRTVWTPSGRWLHGIVFSAKTVLEIAIVLLGASLNVAMIAAAGPQLLLGIAIVVAALLRPLLRCRAGWPRARCPRP